MAKAKTEAEYQEWVKEVAAKIPDEHRAGFEALTGTPVGMELFGGHLREKEFHRRLNEVHSERQALEAQRQTFANDVAAMDEWFQEESPKNQRLIAERDRLKAEAAAMKERLSELGLEEEAPRVKSAKSDNDEDLRREIQNLRQHLAAVDQALPAMLGDYGMILRTAQKEGIDVDPRQVVALSMQRSVPLTQAFDMLTAEERQKRAEKEREEALSKAREEGRREALSQRGSPEYMRPASAAVLEGIANSKPTTQMDRVKGAVQEYYEVAPH